MSADTFGLLELPAPAPDEGDAVTDPALDVVLDFMKAVLNAELGNAWRAVCAADPVPVAYVFNHNPDEESFNANETPAIYAWRQDDPGGDRYSQDLVADTAGFTCLWVPPPAEQENRRAREAIRNGIKKALKAALAQGRHPAWVVDGDDYYEPETYGSVLLRHAAMSKIRLGQFREHTLIIESEDRSFKQPYQCLLFTLETVEFFSYDAEGKLDALDHLQGTTILAARNVLLEGGDTAEGATLDVVSAGETLSYHVELALEGVDVASGPAAGGTVVTIAGKQFIDGMTVLFGETEALPGLIELVDESTLKVTAPAHAAGLVDITVIQAEGGVEKTLANAFTYL